MKMADRLLPIFMQDRSIPDKLLHRLVGPVLAIRDARSLQRLIMRAYALESHKLKLSAADRSGVTSIHQLTPASLQQCILDTAADRDTPDRYRFVLQEIADQPLRNARTGKLNVVAAAAIAQANPAVAAIRSLQPPNNGSGRQQCSTLWIALVVSGLVAIRLVEPKRIISARGITSPPPEAAAGPHISQNARAPERPRRPLARFQAVTNTQNFPGIKMLSSPPDAASPLPKRSNIELVLGIFAIMAWTLTIIVIRFNSFTY